MIRGATKRQACRACALRPLGHHLHQPGFANARVATEQHPLALPGCALRPALQQQCHVLFAADERREPAGGCNVEPRLCAAFPTHAIERHRGGDPLEGLWTQRVHRDIPLDQAVGRLADQHRIRRRQPLEPGSHVGNLPQRQLLLPPGTAHHAHHHQPRVNAHPDGQAQAQVPLQAGIQWFHGRQQPQPGAHRSQGIVFVGLRPAEVHQQGIPK